MLPLRCGRVSDEEGAKERRIQSRMIERERRSVDREGVSRVREKAVRLRKRASASSTRRKRDGRRVQKRGSVGICGRKRERSGRLVGVVTLKRLHW